MTIEIEDDRILELIADGILHADNFDLGLIEEELHLYHLEEFESETKDLRKQHIEILNTIMSLQLKEEDPRDLLTHAENVLESLFIDIVSEENKKKAREILEKGRFWEKSNN